MRRSSSPRVVAALLALAAGAACSSASPGTGEPAPAAAPARPKANEADVRFMTGMIHHHAQALVMARWAPTHGASEALQRLAERIDVAQTDEIMLMRTWLMDVREPAPEPNPAGMTMTMGAMEHVMLMPGMLTEEQMAQLDGARGREFDRLFVTFMIQHHEGALTMVEELFASYGAAQDDFVFKFASDAFADQSTEIERMQRMLDAMSP